MQYILHDISVAAWALRTNHCDRKDCKFEIRWPISVRRAQPTYNGVWLVQLRRPMLYVLNPYSIELDYLLARSPETTN